MFFRAIIKFFGQSFYVDRVAYYIAGGAVILYLFSYFIPVLYDAASIVLLLLGLAILVDTFLIFGKRYALRAERITSERWSNGDENKVVLHFQNNYAFLVFAHIIDELPVQFQERNWRIKTRLETRKEGQVTYTVKPLTRGEYSFGDIN